MNDSLKERKIWPVPMILAFVCIAGLLIANLVHQRSNSDVAKPEAEVEIKVGDNSISTYKIYYGIGARSMAKTLSVYIESVSGEHISTAFGSGSDKYIQIKKGNDKSIRIENGNITITGNNADEIYSEIYVFANTYLGYAFAGESREHVISNITEINIPTDVYSCENPWMNEREPIICLWKTDNPRGIYTNQTTSLKGEILSYSDDQLYQYVKMMKYCGYTGIQVTDMCSSWGAYGSWEFVQQRIRFMADAAHSLDMKFTLWVWGAEFNGYGWNDRDVEYYDNVNGYLARDNVKAREVFDRYYSIYAKLADCSDRVIMHFNDPGNLVDGEDIGYYAAEFKKKCEAVNSDIDFGVNCYTYQIDLEKLEKYTGQDITVYSGVPHTDEDMEECGKFRIYAASHNMKLGIWSWNLTENEIDQLAQMNVNDELIKNCYLRMKELDQFGVPVYYSEMDSYHLTNIFSHYVAGHLQQNPDLDSKELLNEICVSVVGDKYAGDLCEALQIIEDARSGGDWNAFKGALGSEQYILTSNDYPADELYRRCNESIPKIEEMIEQDLECNTIPLPVSTGELLEMILPNLYQIRDFANFRMDLSKLYSARDNGLGQDELAAALQNIYKPIPDYDTIIGTWGGTEARAQYYLIDEFCQESLLNYDFRDSRLDWFRALRMFGEMVDMQSKSKERVIFELDKCFQGGNAYSLEDNIRLALILEANGLIDIKEVTGRADLTDWEIYTYGF